MNDAPLAPSSRILGPTNLSGIREPPANAAFGEVLHAVRQLCRGRSNARGRVTLVGDGAATELVVSAPGVVGVDSSLFLMPMTSTAASEFSAWIWIDDIAAGTFTIHHRAMTKTDCTFMWGVVG